MTTPRRSARTRAATALAATALAAAGIAGCSTAGASTSSTTLAFVPGVAGDSFYISMQCGIQDEAAKKGLKVAVQAPQQFDPSLQTPLVDGVIANQPRAMLIAPTDAHAMVPPVLRAERAGIKVGLVDTSLAVPSLASTSNATDNAAAGAAAADALAKLIGSKGKVLVIAFQAGASTSDARQHGFEAEIKKYPGITYLGPQINDNSPAKAASIITATLAAHPDLAGVFATNQFAAQGAVTGLRNAHRESQVRVVGFDAGPVQVQELQRGEVQALIAQRPYQIGVQAVDQITAALSGSKAGLHRTEGTVTLTRQNLAQQQASVYRTSC